MPASPMPAAAWQNSGNGICRYGQRETDCFRRPVGRSDSRTADATPGNMMAAAAPADTCKT